MYGRVYGSIVEAISQEHLLLKWVSWKNIFQSQRENMNKPELFGMFFKRLRLLFKGED